MRKRKSKRQKGKQRKGDAITREKQNETLFKGSGYIYVKIKISK